MPTPSTASLFSANARSPSRHPLWMTVTSPPSAIGSVATGVSVGISLIIAASWTPLFYLPARAWPRSGEPDPRIGDRERDIRDVVADDREDAAHERVGEQDRIVL